MDATYRALRAAADLGVFTVKALALTAGVNERTARSVLSRNAEYFEHDADLSNVPRQRGGQARPWTLKAERRDDLEDRLAKTVSRLERSELGQLDVTPAGQLTLRSPSPSPELLTGDELDRGLLMAEIELLPRLLQRLLLATEGLSGLSIRTGAGDLVPGYDGVVQAPLGAPPFVPAGPSVWELGAGGDPRDKANSDILERTRRPRNIATKRTAFVFVTTRRLSDWTGGEHAAEWRKVVVIDADALEAWMLSQPAVHIWASELVGLKPLEVSTIEHWYGSWRQYTDPALPAALLTLGREREASALCTAALAVGTDVGIYANSREEARAFIASALLDPVDLDADNEYRLRSALLVETRNEWTRLAAIMRSGILVPNFADADVAAASAKGLTVLVPMGLGDPGRRSTIRLPRIDRVRAAELMLKESQKNESMGSNESDAKMSFAKAERLVREIDQSLTSFRRTHARSRSREKAVWASDRETATLLAPLVLLGGWEAPFVGDREIVAKFARRDYEHVEVQLKALAAEEDPPFFESGGAWRLSSPEDAFDQLGRMLTDATKRLWAELAQAVLGEYDPMLAMEMLDEVPEKLPDRLTYSSSLRQGIARGAALLSALREEGCPMPNATVRSVVRELLVPSDALRWCSVAPMLQALAEADPDAFITAVNQAVADPAEPLKAMFRDGLSGGYGGISPHVYLLWALELLCRSRDHAAAACYALAALSEIDPGGRTGNRPADSLRRVLLPWSPQVNASVDERMEIVKGILQARSVIGWRLLMSLLPQLYDWTQPTPEPTFQDWRLVPVGPAEQIRAWQSLVALAIEVAVDDPVRLQEFVQRLPALSVADRGVVIDALEAVDVDAHGGNVRVAAWQALHDEVARHRQFPNAPWRLSDDVLERLERVIEAWTPADLVARSAMLFQRHPQLGLPQPFTDHERYQQEVESRRDGAFTNLWRDEGPFGIERLAIVASELDTIGWAAADVLSDEARPLMLGWLAKDRANAQVAAGWVGRMAWKHGSEWVTSFLDALRASQASARLAAYQALQDRAETIQQVLSEDVDLQERFWKSADMRIQWNPDVEAVVHELVKHRRSRVAIRVLALKIGPSTPLGADLVKATLDAELIPDVEAPPADAMLGYDIGRLLDFLEQHGLARDELARLEFSYILVPALEHQPKALFALLGERPELFVELVGALVGRGTVDSDGWGHDPAVARAHCSYDALRQWRTPPGSSADGSVDLETLETWVHQVRDLFAQEDLLDLGDEFIGQMLSGVGEGTDGVWPNEPVREILRQVPSDHLRAGLATGRFNSRGTTMRGAFDGGQQERALSEKYADGARKLAARWPETARLLRELADSYSALALQQDHIIDRFRDGR